MLRLLTLAALLLAAVVAGAATGRMHDPDAHASNVVLFTHGEPAGLGPMLDQLSGAHRVASFDVLRSALRPGMLLIIDRSTFDDVPQPFLARWLAEGHPIMALNVPVDTLSARADFAGALGIRDTKFAEIWKANTRLSTPLTRDDYYCGIYVTKPDRSGVWHSGSIQGDVRDNLYRGHLTQMSLMARGETELPGGRIVPLDALDTPQPIAPVPTPSPGF